MANIENVVKVMNFHSLLRVDKAKRKANKFLTVEEELIDIIVHILYNKNLKLDYKDILANKRGKTLNIYIANDMGFCGNFNSSVMEMSKKDTEAQKIMVGEKIFLNDKNTILNISKDDFYHDFKQIENIISSLFNNHQLSEINIIYNRYYSVGDIRLEKRNIYPIKLENTGDNSFDADYIIENDVYELLEHLILLYLCYQIKIIESNSWASENVMREKITRESLKKINNLNEEKNRIERKNKKYISFKKQINNYRKIGE